MSNEISIIDIFINWLYAVPNEVFFEKMYSTIEYNELEEDKKNVLNKIEKATLNFRNELQKIDGEQTNG